MAQVVDGVGISSNEASYGGKALRESAHDEVYLVCKAEVIAYATSLLAEYTQAVGFVNHEGAVVFMLELYDFRKLCKVSLHGEHAVYDNQLDGFFWQLLKHALQILHVVVLVMQLCCKRKPAPINDGSVVSVVANDIVSTAYNRGNDTRIDGKTCRKADGVFLVLKLCKLFF